MIFIKYSVGVGSPNLYLKSQMETKTMHRPHTKMNGFNWLNFSVSTVAAKTFQPLYNIYKAMSGFSTEISFHGFVNIVFVFHASKL